MSKLSPNKTDLKKDKAKAVDKLEQLMLNEEQVICPVKDLFTPGLYTRSLFIPAGTFLTTEIHKTEHPFVLMSGRISVLNVDTDETTHLEGPHIGVTSPGTRRIAHAETDCIWITFHATELTDVEKIADSILVKRDNVTPQYKLGKTFKIQ